MINNGLYSYSPLLERKETMSVRLYLVEDVRYNNDVFKWLRADDNPIGDNLENYLSETTHYYLNDRDFESFKEAVNEDIEELEDNEEKNEQYDILKNIKDYIKEHGEIRIEAW
jgi:hypothetical protein